MAKPRIFISSTFYDLRHIRSSLENFIESLGFEPILSEKGSIAYNPDLPLDESCYRDAESCDVFVLIIGGRYGSPSSTDKKSFSKDFFQRYESITKMEYESANKKDVPIYILIEKPVYSEFDTFKSNRDNKTIKYAHVDSVNIFLLIEMILNQPRNNPIHSFEKHLEIERWLKEQWAGLFKEMLSKRSDRNQIASLSKQVTDLAEINTTLKRYLEEVVSKVSEDDAVKIIKEEDKRLQESKKNSEFQSNIIVKELTDYMKIDLPTVIKIYQEAVSFEDLAKAFEKETMKNKEKFSRVIASEILSRWRTNEDFIKNINSPRIILGLPPLEFKEAVSKNH